MDWDGLVGLPWADRGRGPDAYDCWGLFRLAHERAGLPPLPSFDDRYPDRAGKDAVAAAIAGVLPEWVSVMPGAERPLDGVLMQIEGTWHIGVVTRAGWMLHMPHRGTSVIEPYTTARYANAVKRGGFYRRSDC